MQSRKAVHESSPLVKALRARSEFDEHSPHSELFEKLVRRRITPQQGERNAALVQVTAFLYHSVSEEIAKEFAKQFYLENEHLFHDSLDQHLAEFASLWMGWEKSFYRGLSPAERECYDVLSARRDREAFRICRDLAFHEGIPNFPPPNFYMSCEELGNRLGVDPQQAHRIRKMFKTYRIIEETETGVRRSAGNRGVATKYRWGLASQGNALNS